MKTIPGFFLFPLCAALIGFWSADADAQAGTRGPCAVPSAGNILGLLPGGVAARAATMKRTIQCLQATGQWPAAGAPAGGGSFITFDPPGSVSTIPSGITQDGTIIGYYADTACAAQGGLFCTHGFVRTPTGSFTTFDPLGSAFTVPTAISPSGEIVGAYCDTASCAPGQSHGFVRARDGSFTTFDAPGGTIFAPIYNPGGPPPSVNPAGLIAGTYSVSDGSFTEHGFLRASNGALTTIDVPGSIFTEVLAINPSGTIIGDFCNQTTCFTGFIRFPNGSFTTINTPGSVACGGGSIPIAINSAGMVVGVTSDPTCSVPLGYLRTPDGKITTFGLPLALTFEPLAINPSGLVAGYVFTNGFHGLLRTPDGVITTFDVLGSFGTFAFEISPTGALIGSYFDANGAAHGFLRMP